MNRRARQRRRLGSGTEEMDPALVGAFLVLGAIVGFLAGLARPRRRDDDGAAPHVRLHARRVSRRSTSCTWPSRRRPRRFSSRRSRRCASISGIARSSGRSSPLSRPGSSSDRSSGPQIVGGHVVGAAVGVLRRVRGRGGDQHPGSIASPSPRASFPARSASPLVGGGIGLIASMVGAGGAFMTVPFMTACNVPMRNCVATSAALGLPIAAAGDDRLRHGRDRTVRAAAAHDRLRATCRRCS